MRRHLPWLIPLVAAPLLYLAPLLATEFVPDGGALRWALLTLLLLLLAVVLPLVAVGLSVRNGYRTYRQWRRRRGHLTPTERSVQADEERRRSAWRTAQEMRRSILEGVTPATVEVWDVVSAPGETVFLDASAHYSRYYGRDVTYQQNGGFYLGRPAFVLAGIGLTAMGNARRRSAAEWEAQERWREHQRCRLVVTDQRLLCHAGGQWLSFWYGGMTAVYPEVGDWSLVCQFPDTAPLALHGLSVPSAAVVTVFATHGEEAVRRHPSLQALGA